MHRFLAFIRDETAATTIEYALIASFISIVAFMAIRQIGLSINNTFNSVASNITR